MVGIGGGDVSYERGTPVPLSGECGTNKTAQARFLAFAFRERGRFKFCRRRSAAARSQSAFPKSGCRHIPNCNLVGNSGELDVLVPSSH